MVICYDDEVNINELIHFFSSLCVYTFILFSVTWSGDEELAYKQRMVTI